MLLESVRNLNMLIHLYFKEVSEAFVKGTFNIERKILFYANYK